MEVTFKLFWNYFKMANLSGICELFTQNCSDRTCGSKLVFKKYKSNAKTPLRANNAVRFLLFVNCTSEPSEQKRGNQKAGLNASVERFLLNSAAQRFLPNISLNTNSKPIYVDHTELNC